MSAVVSLFFLDCGLGHMFCLTDFEEWETVHSLPLFKKTDQSHSGRSDEKKKGGKQQFCTKDEQSSGGLFHPFVFFMSEF